MTLKVSKSTNKRILFQILLSSSLSAWTEKLQHESALQDCLLACESNESETCVTCFYGTDNMVSERQVVLLKLNIQGCSLYWALVI